MDWEPVYFSEDEEEKDGEEQVCLMGCTGRGRKNHPTFFSMLHRVPQSAAARDAAQPSVRRKVGMGRAQVFRERSLDHREQGAARPNMRCSSSLISDSNIDVQSSHSAPILHSRVDMPLPPFSNASLQHIGARKQARGRGRANPLAPKQPPKYAEHVQFPFQRSRKKFSLPEYEDTEEEAVRRGLAKSHTWLQSDCKTVEMLSSAEKKLLRSESRTNQEVKIDLGRLLEASGTFARQRVSDKKSSTYSESLKPSPLDVTFGDSTQSLSSFDVKNQEIDESCNEIHTVLTSKLSDLQSNSPFISPELSPNISLSDSHEELVEFSKQNFEQACAGAVTFTLEALGKTDVTPKDDADLFIDIGDEELMHDTGEFYGSVFSQREKELERERLKMYYSSDDSHGTMIKQTVVEDTDKLKSAISFSNAMEHNVLNSHFLVERKEKGATAPQDLEGVAAFPSVDIDEECLTSYKTESDEEDDEDCIEGKALIKNIPDSKENRELIRDMVQHYGDLKLYEEQQQQDNTVQIKVKFRRHPEVEMMYNCLHGSDGLFENCVIEVEDISDISHY